MFDQSISILAEHLLDDKVYSVLVLGLIGVKYRGVAPFVVQDALL